MQFLVVFCLAWLCIAFAQLDGMIDKLHKKGAIDDINFNRHNHVDMALQSNNYYAEYFQFDHNSCSGDILYYSSYLTYPRQVFNSCSSNSPVNGNSEFAEVISSDVYPPLPNAVQNPSSDYLLMT